MKKSILTLLLMLATMSMTAQTIDGTWAADEAFRKEMGLDKEERYEPDDFFRQGKD